MRYLLAALATVLVALLFVAPSAAEYGRDPDVVRVVRQALREMDSATELALRDTRTKQESYLNLFVLVGSQVSVVGPIPAVIALERYWFQQLLNFAQNAFDNLKEQYAKLLEGIRYQVKRLTRCSNEDANAVIVGFIQRLEVEISGIRDTNTPQLRALLEEGNRIALQLRQQALHGCYTNWNQLERQLMDNLRSIAKRFDALFKERHAKIRAITHQELAAILERVKQLAIRPIRYSVQALEC